MEEIHMKKEKDLIKDFSKKFIKRMVEKDSTGWPPDCTLFAYQPVRPCRKKNRDDQGKYVVKDEAGIVWGRDLFDGAITKQFVRSSSYASD